MNAFQFVDEVASHLLEMAGLDFKKSVDKQRDRLERRGFGLRPINHALSEAIRAVAPDKAAELLGNKTIRSSRVAARLLYRAAKVSHPFSAACQTNLGLAFGMFLGLLSRKPPADESGLTLEERIAVMVEEQASMVIQRWGFLMVEPENLLVAAAILNGCATDQRLNRLEEMVRTFSNLRSRVTPEEFSAVVANIWIEPAAKA